jgi:hypothetical protein
MSTFPYTDKEAVIVTASVDEFTYRSVGMAEKPLDPLDELGTRDRLARGRLAPLIDKFISRFVGMAEKRVSW